LKGPESFSIWRWAATAAILTGLIQVLVMALARLVTNRIVLLNPDMIWMVPVANGVVFGVAALAIRLVITVMPRVPAQVVGVAVLLFLAVLGPLTMVPRLHVLAALLLAAGVAVQGARLIQARAPRVNRLVHRAVPILVALVVIGGVGSRATAALTARSRQAALPAAHPNAPNVLLIVLDTVRAQSLSVYGYARPTSPRLEEFARTGIVFDNAMATAPWTLPSHATMFTGRLPHELSGDWLTPLDAAHPTVAEALAGRGYVTEGFAANLLYTTAATGLDRGFLHYRDYPMSFAAFAHQSWLARVIARPLRGVLEFEEGRIVRRRGAEITDEFLTWLSARPDRPFFAFLNYFDAHEPYDPPPPFADRFGGGPMPDMTVRRSWSPEQIQRSMDAYDSAVAYDDNEIGRVLAGLERDGLRDNTIVIVTSDHGEQFGEHGLFDHANSLYLPLLHVPLLISLPGHAPANVRVPDAVSLLDLAATILDLAGPAASSGSLPGRSLARFWQPGADQGSDEPLFAEVSKGINLPKWQPVSRGAMQSVWLRGWHYIHHDVGEEELYNTEQDRAELVNLVDRADAAPALESARRALAAMRGKR
jgi:arylsulfatase A-like enzyme